MWLLKPVLWVIDNEWLGIRTQLLLIALYIAIPIAIVWSIAKAVYGDLRFLVVILPAFGLLIVGTYVVKRSQRQSKEREQSHSQLRRIRSQIYDRGYLPSLEAVADGDTAGIPTDFEYFEPETIKRQHGSFEMDGMTRSDELIVADQHTSIAKITVNVDALPAWTKHRISIYQDRSMDVAQQLWAAIELQQLGQWLAANETSCLPDRTHQQWQDEKQAGLLD